MSRLIATCVAGIIIIGTVAPVAADGFHPFRTARKAANLGLDTAHRAVDLGLDTAKGAFDVARDAVTPDNCRPGKYYKAATAAGTSATEQAFDRQSLILGLGSPPL
jgi:hypothetical protein